MAIHAGQENAAKNHDNIFISSRFEYDAYINQIDATLSYDEKSKNDIDNKTYNNFDNSVHFTSASLSQAAKESAIATFDKTKIANNIQEIQLNESSKLSYGKEEPLSLNIKANFGLL